MHHKEPIVKMNETRWDDARNILCIRLDNLGDVLMTTPAMRALKESVPNRRITLLGARAGVHAASFIPEVDDVIEYQAPWMKSTEARSASVDDEMIRTLRTRRFDGAVIFTVYSQSPLPAALLCHLSGIPLRLAHCHENPYHLLTDWIPDPEPQTQMRHEVRRQLDLVAAIGCETVDECLSFRPNANDVIWARRRLAAADIEGSNQRWILLHPGASAPSRRYPPEMWARAADEMAIQLNFPIVFSGNSEEMSLVESIRSSMRAMSYSFAGELNLGQLGALISLAPLLLCGNTGPAHIAAAVGTPVVDLYALTNPQHTPWRVSSRVLFHDVPCRFCYKSICPEGHHNCLRLVSPDAVAAAGVELLRTCLRSNRACAGGYLGAGLGATTQQGHPL
jgi:lipopolysaccharide heptosyltransferase II